MDLVKSAQSEDLSKDLLGNNILALDLHSDLCSEINSETPSANLSLLEEHRLCKRQSQLPLSNWHPDKENELLRFRSDKDLNKSSTKIWGLPREIRGLHSRNPC